MRVGSSRFLCILSVLVGLASCMASAASLPRVVINNESGAFVEQGSIVNLCGSVDIQLVQTTCLLVDRKAVASKYGNGDYSLCWDTGAVSCGQHHLEISAISANGAKKTVSRAEVTVVPNSPVKLSVPAGVVSLNGPQKITLNCAPGYSPTRARLYVDSVPLKQELAAKNGAVEWDASDVPTGSHTLAVVTWDSADCIAFSHSISVEVPGRLAVSAPDSAVITEANAYIPVDVTIPEGVAVKRLAAYCDGKLAVELGSRCAQIKVPALDLESGKHEITIELTDNGDTLHKCGPQSVSVDNQYKAAIAAKAAAEKAAAEAAEKADQDRLAAGIAAGKAHDEAVAARAKAKDQQKRLNDRVLSSGYRDAASQAGERGKLASSGGTIGRVRGMSILVIDDVHEFGSVFTITAKVTSGTGSVTVNASDVDEDFMDSITNARKYVMAYIAKTGYKVDWMKTNIDLHYQRSGPKGGDSAGAAMATAILSSLLKVPIRNEVVITGAIEADGTIMPVGGIDLKAAAAFSDPTVLTVVVPRFVDNVADVLALPPKLLVGHRLVAAQDMGQVLRQAMVGYDQGTLSSASRLFNQGLGLYSVGQIDEAKAKLKEAAAVTPEDLTIPLWIQVMDAPQR